MSAYCTHTLIGTWALVIKRALDHQQLNGRQALIDAGIDPESCFDSKSRISTNTMNQLWEKAVELTGNPLFGLIAPNYTLATTFHALGMANLASSTIREALNRTAKYSKLISTSATLRTVSNSQYAIIIIEPTAGSPPPHPCSVDSFLKLACLLPKFIHFHSTMHPMKVCIANGRDGLEHEYQKALGCEVEFNCGRNAVYFDRKTLDTPLPSGNLEVARTMESLIEDYIYAFNQEDIQYRVHSIILKLLPTGEPTLERVAEQLSMSSRNLHRRLASQDIQFKKLLDDLRYKLALDYLNNDRYIITEITYRLGFYDNSSFSRAFKRWSGCTPAMYRKRIHSTQVDNA